MSHRVTSCHMLENLTGGHPVPNGDGFFLSHVAPLRQSHVVCCAENRHFLIFKLFF